MSREERVKNEREQAQKDREKREADHKEERKKVKKDYYDGVERKEKEIKKTEKARPYKTSKPMRIFNFILGLSFLILPSYVLLNEDLVIDTIIVIFAIMLALSGLGRMINAFYSKNIGGTKRLIRLFIGLVILIMASIVIIFPDLAESSILIILAIIIIIQGIGRVFLGLSHPTYPFWLKISMILIGATSILLGLTAFSSITIASITIENSDLIMLIAISIFLGGISRIAQSLAGLNEKKNK
ncbi:MAG: DUF308 domain-containing protein [Candidatus Heimdallarchaeota archaeon]|nr:DUF308 domain-containing protein [Candidatus Heimdallarchaeota archaeon]